MSDVISNRGKVWYSPAPWMKPLLLYINADWCSWALYDLKAICRFLHQSDVRNKISQFKLTTHDVLNQNLSNKAAWSVAVRFKLWHSRSTSSVNFGCVTFCVNFCLLHAAVSFKINFFLHRNWSFATKTSSDLSNKSIWLSLEKQ